MSDYTKTNQTFTANFGPLQKLSGEDGATFTPEVSETGDLSWTNDKGLDNPETVNIKGPKGDKGSKGEQGPQGVKGDPGYTPQKNVDYFDGKDGKDGYTPVVGKDFYTEAEKETFSKEIEESVRAEFEEQKGRIITGEGAPTDPAEEKLGQLYYDEDSSPPAVYVCAKIDDENFAWLPVDVMGRDAYDLAAATAFDVYGGEGSIAQNYQRIWDKVTKITEESTDVQYPSALAVKSYVDSSMKSAILDSWEVAV